MSGGGLRGVVVRNVGYQALGQVVSIVTGLVTAVVLSRHLGVEGYGGFTYLFAFIYLFLALNDLGVDTIVVREIAKKPERSAELIGAMLTFRLGLAVGTMGLAWAAIWWMDFAPDLGWSLRLLALLLPLNALRLPSTVFQARLRIGYGAIVEVVTRLSGLALVLTAVVLGWRLIGITLALVAAEVIGVAVIWGLSRRFVRPVWRIDPALWATVLSGSVPLGLAGLLVALTNRLDFLMLERMADLNQVGLYGAAYRVTSLVERFPLLVMITLFPVMARAARDDAAELRRIYRRTLGWFAAIGLPLAVGVAWASPWLLGVMFGAEFVAAAPGLRVLVWSTACLYLAAAGGNLLIAAGRERISLGAWIAGTTLNVALNLAWIPRWGFVGAAAATVCTFVLILVVTLVAVEWSLRHLAVHGPPAAAPGAAPAADGLAADLIEGR